MSSLDTPARADKPRRYTRDGDLADWLKDLLLPWHKRAGDLADWTLARLVNRTDACDAYYHGGQITRRVDVSHALLARHFRAEHTGDIKRFCRLAVSSVMV